MVFIRKFRNICQVLDFHVYNLHVYEKIVSKKKEEEVTFSAFKICATTITLLIGQK